MQQTEYVMTLFMSVTRKNARGEGFSTGDKFFSMFATHALNDVRDFGKQKSLC